MRMLKFLRLAVFVACIAAFASGCGGGGGGGASAPVMECPQGQVGTYPDCMDPPPTDEERIAEARNTIAGIVTQANAIEQAARSAVTAVESNADATDEDIADARFHGNAALDALREIVRASGVVNAATTGAQAEGAVVSANAALGRLNVARTEAVNIRSRVEAVGNLREQQAAEEQLATNGSSLIKHVRANKLLVDGVLGAAGAKLVPGADAVTGSIRVGTATNPGDISSGARTPCTAPCAEYAANSEGTNRVAGQRTVKVQTLVSSSTTPTLTGTGRLPHGFDLNNGTTFVNAYTDIAQERRGARKTGTDAPDPDVDTPTTPYNEQYDYILDNDYLLAGIWLTVGADLSTSEIVAFAYGSQPTSNATPNFCGSNEGTASPGTSTTPTGGTTTTTRICGNTAGFNTIAGDTGFVKDGQDVKATYNGNANGVYLAGSDTSYFTADVKLDAEFRNPTGGDTDGEGSIVGAVTNIVAGGQQMAGSIELQKQDLGATGGARNDISPAFTGSTVGVVDGKSYGGSWKGQFFGMGRRQVTRSQTTQRQANTPSDGHTTTTITTTYSPQAPGSVAGTFYATQQSAPAGSAAFIGSFAAHR